MVLPTKKEPPTTENCNMHAAIPIEFFLCLPDQSPPAPTKKLTPIPSRDLTPIPVDQKMTVSHFTDGHAHQLSIQLPEDLFQKGNAEIFFFTRVMLRYAPPGQFDQDNPTDHRPKQVKF